MTFNYVLFKPLEQNISAYLTAVRESDPVNYRVTMFALFTDMNDTKAAAVDAWYIANPQQTRRSSDYGVTAGTFNATVGHLKKIGMIGTCKGGEEVFLSNAAWGLHQTKQAVKS